MDLSQYTMSQLNQQNNQNSIFKSLLTEIELQITSPQKNNLINEPQFINHDPFNLYAIQQQNQYLPKTKSISQWVWKDQFQSQNDSLSPVYQINPQNLQLKRVQSMRIEQENKLNSFIRSNHLINPNDDYESASNLNFTLGLSPRKKKRIDKQRDHKEYHKQKDNKYKFNNKEIKMNFSNLDNQKEKIYKNSDSD